MFDLHTHSTASDGSLSPSLLVEEAAKRSISILALTDHDSIGGLEEASKAALLKGIKLIPGIELEINWNESFKGEFHLLGLGIKKPSTGFIDAVEEMANRRENRNLGIVEEMNKAGINVSYDEVRAFSGSETIAKPMVGRPHFAAMLVKRKIVKNIKQAFQRYLGKGKQFFIPRIGLGFEQAVSIIHESGGIAVLAHPMSLYLSWGKLPDFISGLKGMGLDGIEAWHSLSKVSACKRLQQLGDELNLITTAGSDFHGKNVPNRKLGYTAGEKKINESLINRMSLDAINSLL